MTKIRLNNDGQFIVGEEKILNYILSILCIVLFLYGVIDAVKRHFINIDYQSFVFALALVPAYIFFRKSRSKRIFIRINKNGIYQEEKLVTGWPFLLNAYVDQKEKKNFFSIQDNFQMVLEYRKKDVANQVFRSKIPLTNTQNKSEEEVLEAVMFFWMEYRRSAEV